MARKGPDGLTDRQRRFVEAYLLNPVASHAAVAAGYGPKSAKENGRRLKAQPAVAAALARAEAERAARVQVTADDVLRELWRIGKADLRLAFDDNSRLLPVKQLPDDIALVISGVDNEEMRDDGETIGDVRKVRTWDKVKALELIGKHLAMWVDRSELTGAGGGPVTFVFPPIPGDEEPDA